MLQTKRKMIQEMLMVIVLESAHCCAAVDYAAFQLPTAFAVTSAFLSSIVASMLTNAKFIAGHLFAS